MAYSNIIPQATYIALFCLLLPPFASIFLKLHGLKQQTAQRDTFYGELGWKSSVGKIWDVFGEGVLVDNNGNWSGKV